MVIFVNVCTKIDIRQRMYLQASPGLKNHEQYVQCDLEHVTVIVIVNIGIGFIVLLL